MIKKASITIALLSLFTNQSFGNALDDFIKGSGVNKQLNTKKVSKNINSTNHPNFSGSWSGNCNVNYWDNSSEEYNELFTIQHSVSDQTNIEFFTVNYNKGNGDTNVVNESMTEIHSTPQFMTNTTSTLNWNTDGNKLIFSSDHVYRPYSADANYETTRTVYEFVHNQLVKTKTRYKANGEETDSSPHKLFTEKCIYNKN